MTARPAMTTKQRWMAAVRMQPVDRLPFWPKLDGAYARAQAAPFRAMPADAIHDWIGSDKHSWVGGCLRERRARTSAETHTAGDLRRTVYTAPGGRMERVDQFDGPSQSWHPVAFPVRRATDVRLMVEIVADVTVDVDHAGVQQAREQMRHIGESAIVGDGGMGESPLMDWVEWLAGVEMAHYLLADCPAEVEALFDALHRLILRRTEILVTHSPADVLYLTENTSTTLISPEQYRRYCGRHIGEYARLTNEAGRPLVLHMCGHLRALLPDLACLPVQAFEAFTSPTLGNTTLCDGRRACPDKCLIGGTNAMLWTQPAEAIVAQIDRDLEDLPHHRGLVITSAGVMPPCCRPETIKRVRDWVVQYAARM